MLKPDRSNSYTLGSNYDMSGEYDKSAHKIDDTAAMEYISVDEDDIAVNLEILNENGDNVDYILSNGDYYNDSVMIDTQLLNESPYYGLLNATECIEQVVETQDLFECDNVIFICTVCSLEFVDEAAYNKHVAEHNTENCEGYTLPQPGSELALSNDSPASETNAISSIDQQIQEQSDEVYVHPKLITDAPLFANHQELKTHSAEEVNIVQNSNEIVSVNESVSLKTIYLDSSCVFDELKICNTYKATQVESQMSECYDNDIVTKHCEYQTPSPKHAHVAENVKPILKFICIKRNDTRISQDEPLQIKNGGDQKLWLDKRINLSTIDLNANCDRTRNIDNNFLSNQGRSLEIHPKTAKYYQMDACDDAINKYCSYQTPSQNVDIPKSTQMEPLSSNVNNVKQFEVFSSDTHSKSYKTFICDFCQRVFRRRHYLEKHINSHVNAKPYSCKLCQYKAVNNINLAKHMKIHTDEKTFTCKLCDFTCTQESSLVSHMQVHMVKKPFTCNLCDYKCTQKLNLVYHMKIHAKPFTCKLCDYKCRHESNFANHMKIHIKPFTCNLCNYKCTQKLSLVNHMKIHAKPFTCKLCDYKCTQKSTLASHMTVHTTKKPYSCKLCDYKCAQKCSLVGHMTIHASEKPFTCSFCEYKCANNSAFKKHIRTHTGEKPYSCTLCNYKCSYKAYLSSHMKIHTGEKPLSCTYCDYKCLHRATLLNHVKTHTGEKPLSCNLCNYKCICYTAIVNHMRTHTGEKPYSCKLCNYKCAQKVSLVNHTRTHTGEKPFKCKLCDYKCAYNSALIKHAKRHHDE